MNTLLLTGLIRGRASIVFWVVVLSLMLLFRVFEWLYFRRSTDVALKRKVFWWSAVIGLIVIVPLYLLTYELMWALISVACFAAVIFFSIRNTRICSHCAKTNYDYLAFLGPPESCSKCGAALTEKITA